MPLFSHFHTIFHTIIECLNTILIVDIEEMNKQKIYLYENIINKFFHKKDLFKDIELRNKLDDKYKNIKKYRRI